MSLCELRARWRGFWVAVGDGSHTVNPVCWVNDKEPRPFDSGNYMEIMISCAPSHRLPALSTLSQALRIFMIMQFKLFTLSIPECLYDQSSLSICQQRDDLSIYFGYSFFVIVPMRLSESKRIHACELY